MKDISYYAYPVFCLLGNTKNPSVKFEMLDNLNNTVELKIYRNNMQDSKTIIKLLM